MRARPFLILGDQDRTRLVQWGQACADDWAINWLAKGAPRPAVTWSSPPAPDRWLVADGGEGQSVGVGYADEWLEHAGALLAGDESAEPGASELVREIVEQGLRELATCLCAPPSDVLDWRAEVPAQADVRASYVVLACHVGDEVPALTFLCSPERAARLLRTIPPASALPLVPTVQAIKGRPLRIRVLLGMAEVTVSELATLATGDVLVLDRRLDQALPVTIECGAPFADGQLCAVHGFRAIEVRPLAR